MLFFPICLALVLALKTESISLEFDPAEHSYIPVPPSFLGLSHEPLTMAKHVLPTAEYQGLIRLLSSYDTGPFVIRWGGNEQDRLLKPLKDDQWEAMRDLHEAVGVRYMIGLNLKVRDSYMNC